MSYAKDWSADITVLVSTSLIPSHPSTALASATLHSVRAHLGRSPIIVMADGNDDPRYFSYLYSLHQQCYDSGYPRVFGIQRHATRVHQSGMLKEALDAVDTPLLLYVEHDWTLLDDIPWPELSTLILRGDFNSIKLHANPRISPFYEHMMEERVMYQNGVPSDRHHGERPMPVVPIIKTRQWSQNPHLASTQFYRDKILPMVEGKCDFIENIIHGIVANSPWSEFKTGIFNPEGGDMMRVRHLDGKGTRL